MELTSIDHRRQEGESPVQLHNESRTVDTREIDTEQGNILPWIFQCQGTRS